MAVSKLALYNNALLLLGQRKLAAVDEDRPPRHYLDGAYDLGAIEFCLEVAQPYFARKTVELDTSAVSAEHALDNVFTLPTDFVTVYRVYSDDTLDTPVDRYIIEDNTLACSHDTIYLRYISDTYVTTFDYWSPSFAAVVSAYLASQVAIKIAPSKYEGLEAYFQDRVKVTQELDSGKEPDQRPSTPEVTLTEAWRLIYNDALQIMGLDIISSLGDDSDRKVKLDRALNSNLVEMLLEDIGWQFALKSTMSQYDPSLEPEWGYSRVHAHPEDMHRLDGIYGDSYMRYPIRRYSDEDEKFFCDYEDIYVQYVSTNFLTGPSNWPAFFKRLVAGRLAKDACAALEGADTDRADLEYDDRRDSALSNDAVTSPPKIFTEGSWIRSRYKFSYRGRP